MASSKPRILVTRRLPPNVTARLERQLDELRAQAEERGKAFAPAPALTLSEEERVALHVLGYAP